MTQTKLSGARAGDRDGHDYGKHSRPRDARVTRRRRRVPAPMWRASRSIWIAQQLALVLLAASLVPAITAGASDGGPETTGSDNIWMDFTPGSGGWGGVFEDGQWVRDTDVADGGSWSLMEHVDGSRWVLQSQRVQDDFDDTPILNWADSPGIYSEVRSDLDISDGDPSTMGAWAVGAAEQGGIFVEDGRGVARAYRWFDLDDYIPPSHQPATITLARVYVDYAVQSDDFNHANSWLYFNSFLGDDTGNDNPSLEFNKNSGDPLAAFGGRCQDYWDPGITGANPNEQNHNDHTRTNMDGGTSIANWLNTHSTSSHRFNLIFAADLRLYGTDSNLEWIKFWLDDVKIYLEYSYNLAPSAVIDNISPSPSDEGQPVTFLGHGIDSDGTVVGWNWRSSIDGQLSTLEDFSSAGLSVGAHTIFYKVLDGQGAWSSEETRPHTVRALQDEVHLSTGGVSRTSGDTATSFTYEVTYLDSRNHVPGSRNVVIDGSPFPMNYVSGSHDSGALYRYQSILPVGTHDFYFEFDDGLGHADRLPTASALPGPTVSGGGTIEIVAVRSEHQNFFVRGVLLTNTFEAILETSLEVSEVRFSTSGGQSSTDTSPDGRWTASFEMADTFVGERLFVEAEATNGDMARAEIPLNVLDPPIWLQDLLAVSTTTVSTTTQRDYDNVWTLHASLRIPQDVFSLGVDVPETVPLFSGAYDFGWFFVVEFSITSERAVTLEGGGGLEAALFGRSTDIEFSLEGSWRIEGDTLIWERLIIRGSAESPIPLITTRYLDITVQDGFTVVKALVEFSIVPSVELAFTFEPGTDGLVVVSGVSLVEISGELGIAVRGEGNLTLLGYTVGAVEAELGASVTLETSEDWLRKFELYGRLSFTVFDSTFDVEMTWSTEEPSTRGGGSDPTWNVTPVSGRRPEFASAGADFLKIWMEGLTEDVNANATFNPPPKSEPPFLLMGAIGGVAVLGAVFLVWRWKRRRGGSEELPTGAQRKS